MFWFMLFVVVIELMFILFSIWCIDLIFGFNILWNWNVWWVVKWMLLYMVCLVVNLLMVNYWFGVIILLGKWVCNIILWSGLSFCFVCLVWILWLFCWYILWKWISWKLLVVKLLVRLFLRLVVMVLCKLLFLCFKCLLLVSLFLMINGDFLLFINRYFFDNVLFFVIL